MVSLKQIEYLEFKHNRVNPTKYLLCSCISPVIAKLNQSKSDFTMVRYTGLFDLSLSAAFLSKEIIAMAEEGIHAVLFVLSVNSRTQEDEFTLVSLQRIFESKLLDYLIVVFTGGDIFEEEGMTLDDYLNEDCSEFLKVNLLSSPSLFFFFFFIKIFM